jgi:hypothetical protein
MYEFVSGRSELLSRLKAETICTFGGASGLRMITGVIVLYPETLDRVWYGDLSHGQKWLPTKVSVYRILFRQVRPHRRRERAAQAAFAPRQSVLFFVAVLLAQNRWLLLRTDCGR